MSLAVDYEVAVLEPGHGIATVEKIALPRPRVGVTEGQLATSDRVTRITGRMSTTA
jgi:hypothetical protein